MLVCLTGATILVMVAFMSLRDAGPGEEFKAIGPDWRTPAGQENTRGGAGPSLSEGRREFAETKPARLQNQMKAGAAEASGRPGSSDLIVNRAQDPDNPEGLVESGMLVEGKKEGTWSVYWADGTLWATHEFKGGVLNGESRVYAQDTGLVLDKTLYKEGKLDGISQGWHVSGLLAWEAEYQKGKLSGVQRTWFDDGSIKSVETYVAGQKHGWCSYWLSSGGLDPKRRTGRYVQGDYME